MQQLHVDTQDHHAVRGPVEGARPEELPRPDLLLPPERRSRPHATRPAAADEAVVRGCVGTGDHQTLCSGAIAPFREQGGALRGAPGVRQKKRAPLGQVSARHDL